jgi:hypothetical protein
MTTILIDFKNKKIVADNQTTYSKKHSDFLGSSGRDYFYPQKESKIFLVSKKERVYFTGAGDAHELDRQLKSLRRDTKFLSRPKGEVKIALIREKNGGLLVDIYETKYSKYLQVAYWHKEIIQGNSQVITLGSGGDFAYGAFMAGCSAEESVIAASRCDTSTGLGITTVEVK